jgi:hypothetical protein
MRLYAVIPTCSHHRFAVLLQFGTAVPTGLISLEGLGAIKAAPLIAPLLVGANDIGACFAVWDY